ncbi:Cytochrome P450 [Neofusicoccum parvum]|uniref:Cytochrome P450 n=1 Tax=Neofusicoccum parvum TaxID=310453 RepID=A0ACB5SED1_9PEZI|nr:Cytochrome P450 [Neofusicoccum parvum]
MVVTGPLGSFALVILACIFLYRFIIHPAFVSPLSKVPAVQPTARYSSLWMNWQRYRHNELNTLFQAHQKHGPVVLVGPSEISINCVKGGLQTVYLGGFEKPDWYANLFVNFGMPNMVSFMDHHSHSVRKRIVSNIYSKSTILNSVCLRGVTQTVIQERFVPFLRSAAKSSTNVDVYSLFGGAAMDIVTGYLFGLSASTDFTTNEAERRRFHDIYFSRRGPDFWLQFPNLVQTLKKYLGIKLIPDSMTDATLEIEAYVLAMCDKATTHLSQPPPRPPPSSHHPTVHAHLSAALAAQNPRTPAPTLRLALASELMDHTIAGYETSTVALTYLAWHLSAQPSLQRALRRALLALPPAADPRALDALPLLHALVCETLRLHTGAPGPQARVTPHVAGGTALGPPGQCYVGIPGGVRVAACAWCVHRNAEVFPEPEAWRPERWLDGKGEVLGVGKAEGPGRGGGGGGGGGEKGGGGGEEEERAREMGRWFWAFGSGGRVCVGSHLALYQIKHVIAALYANFETEIVDDEGIEQEDHFLAHPKGHKLILRLKEIN